MPRKFLFTCGVLVTTLASWLALFAAFEVLTRHLQPRFMLVLSLIVAPFLEVKAISALLGLSHPPLATLGVFLTALTVTLPWMTASDLALNVVSASTILILGWPLVATIAAINRASLSEG